MRTRRRRHTRKHRIWLGLLLGLLLGIAAVCGLERWFRPAVIAVACDHLSNQISGQIHDVVNAELEEEELSYDAICTVLRDSDGNITALQTNMARVNLLKSTVTTEVAQEFDHSLMAERFEIPLGSVLPGMMLAGYGPNIRVTVMSVGNISAEFQNEFFAAGMNQTLHRVVLTVTSELRLLLPGGIYEFTDETRMILAETVLLGQVPQSYVDLSDTESYFRYGTGDKTDG